MNKECNAMFNSVVKDRSMPSAFAEALSTWRGYISSVVYKLGYLEGEEQEDILQELLMVLTRTAMGYDTPLYQHEGKNYELDRSELTGGVEYYHLKAERTALRPHDPICVPASEAVLLKKASLKSLMYTVIRQFNSDYLVAKYSSRRGYDTKQEERLAAVRDSGEVKYVVKGVPTEVQFAKTVPLVAMESSESSEASVTLEHSIGEAEVAERYVDLQRRVEGLSDEVQEVVRRLYEGDSFNELRKTGALSWSQSGHVKQTLRKAFQGLTPPAASSSAPLFSY